MNILNLASEKQAAEFLKTWRNNRTPGIAYQDFITVLKAASQEWERNPIWVEKCNQLLHDERVLSDEIAGMLDPHHWTQRLEWELPLWRAQNGRLESPHSQAILSYRPLGEMLHVAPGNSYLGGLESLLHGIACGNFNVLRISTKTAPVIKVLCELLQQCGVPEHQMPLVSWVAGSPIERLFKFEMDAIAVWGSDEAIDAYRAGLGPGVRLIEFGPKLSVSIISKSPHISAGDLEGIARDVARYDQISCASTQAILIQTESQRKFLWKSLGEAFEAQSQKIPAPTRSKNAQVEILKSFEKAKALEALGLGETMGRFPDWNLIYHFKKSIEPSPLFRTANIYVFENDLELAQLLNPIRSYLQTCSIACPESEVVDWAEKLWGLGINRVVDAGRSTEPMEGAPHDGGFMLPRFAKVVSLESPRRAKHHGLIGSSKGHFAKLKEIVRLAYRAPFYRDRFDHSGLQDGKLESYEQFLKIPLLQKRDFYNYGPPKSAQLLTESLDQVPAYIFTTGGSTGEPKYVAYSKKEWDEVTDVFAKEFESLGIGPEDRFANLFHGGGLWSAFIAVTEAAEKLGCTNFPIGSDMAPEQALRVIKDFGITACFGLPSTLVRLAHELESKPHLKLRLPKILYGGEHLTPSMHEYLKRVFDAEIIKSGYYASVDAGCIGYQCAHLPPGQQHVFESGAFVEIIDETKMIPCGPGETGTLVVTNLSRTLLPAIRLNSGDRGRLINSPCPCGTTAMTFELLGRADDMVRVGGANVYVSDIDRLVAKFPQTLSPIYQIHLSKKGIDDSLEIIIETQKSLSATQTAEVKKQIDKAYSQIAEEVREHREKGFLKHFQLILAPPGAIHGHARTGKVRRVIDERLN
ncbi:MAG: AMP-binding protein [Oligoflexia bacterium]|nr:AMP-binding protein [Oligoflexia bacterium]